MTTLKLTDKSIARLSSLLTAYITTLNTMVETLGLEGEWTFDPLTGSLVSKEPEAQA